MRGPEGGKREDGEHLEAGSILMGLNMLEQPEEWYKVLPVSALDLGLFEGAATEEGKTTSVNVLDCPYNLLYKTLAETKIQGNQPWFC